MRDVTLFAIMFSPPSTAFARQTGDGLSDAKTTAR